MPYKNNSNNKIVNHLASDTEKLSMTTNFINEMPLADKLNQLQEVTTELKLIIKSGLPDEILNHCWVVNYSSNEMTLAVNSVTAHNHIHYIRQNLIELLQQNSPMFKNLTDLKVKVVHLPST